MGRKFTIIYTGARTQNQLTIVHEVRNDFKIVANLHDESSAGLEDLYESLSTLSESVVSRLILKPVPKNSD